LAYVFLRNNHYKGGGKPVRRGGGGISGRFGTLFVSAAFALCEACGTPLRVRWRLDCSSSVAAGAALPIQGRQSCFASPGTSAGNAQTPHVRGFQNDKHCK
jgi:hypothetical protein